MFVICLKDVTLVAHMTEVYVNYLKVCFYLLFHFCFWMPTLHGGSYWLFLLVLRMEEVILDWVLKSNRAWVCGLKTEGDFFLFSKEQKINKKEKEMVRSRERKNIYKYERKRICTISHARAKILEVFLFLLFLFHLISPFTNCCN